MEEIKYGQLWARHSEVVNTEDLGKYRIDFDGLKNAVQEAIEFTMKRQQAVGLGLIEDKPQTGPVWVKASERYPEKDDKYFIRQNGAKSAANLWQYTKEYWQTTEMEWLDESEAAPSGEREVAFAGADQIHTAKL